MWPDFGKKNLMAEILLKFWLSFHCNWDYGILQKRKKEKKRRDRRERRLQEVTVEIKWNGRNSAITFLL